MKIIVEVGDAIAKALAECKRRYPGQGHAAAHDALMEFHVRRELVAEERAC